MTTAAAKRPRRRFHANVLLFVLIASLEISEGLPLSPTLFYNDLPYDRATSSAGNEGGPVVYRANELHGLLDELNPEESSFQSDEVFSTENGNVARRLLGGRKLHGNIIIFSSSGKPEFSAREEMDRNRLGRLYYAHSKNPYYSFREMDAVFPLYSAAEDGNTGRPRKSSRLGQQDGMLDDLLFTHPSDYDESAWEDDRGMSNGSKTKRVFFRSKSSSSSKRGESAAIRNEGAVHPVFLGYGQETAASALSTLARLLADRQMNPSDGRTRESIRFIG